MKTKVRRKEREMTSTADMERLLAERPVGHLAVVTPDGPYVVAVNYLYDEGFIYVHSNPCGRKMDALKADPRVCFEVEEVGPQVLWAQRCGITQVYRSVVCFGTAARVEDHQEKSTVLGKMVRKFVGPGYGPFAMEEQNVERTALIRISVEAMTGKDNRLSEVHTVINPSPPRSSLR